jgi:inosine-uridine nucleoside N-ribohydrolase
MDIELTVDELKYFAGKQSKPARFCSACIKTSMDSLNNSEGATSTIMHGPITFTVLAKPEFILDSFKSYSRIEAEGSKEVYGTTVNDRRTEKTHPFRANNNEVIPDFNCTVVHRINAKAFKDYFFHLLQG